MKRTLALTSPQLVGEDVAYAQRVLKTRGFYRGAVDRHFGEQTAQACHAAKWTLGYRDAKLTQAGGGRNFDTPLERFLTGKAKPSMAMRARAAARKRQQPASLRLKALAEMSHFVGMVEQPPGSNHVPGLTDWWGWGNVAWCAITCSKAYVLAGAKHFKRGSLYAYVPTLVAHARQGINGLSVVTDPQPGDLVCFDWDGSNFSAGNNHVGMFDRGNRTQFRTIEGNWSQRCDYVNRHAGSAPRIVFVRVSE